MSGGADPVVELEDVVARWSEESAAIDDSAIDALLDRYEGPWIALGEAEEVARVSRSTLRAWYRSGRVPSRLMPGPHGLQRLVPRDAVLQQAARSPRTGATSRPAEKEPIMVASPDSDTVRLAELAVNEARERAAAAEARAEAAEAALHAALERAAAAEAELRLLRG